MTQALPITSTQNSQTTDDGRETFLGVVVRRGRYIVAIILSALILYYVAWHALMPAPALAGTSIIGWPASPVGSMLLGILLTTLAVLLAVAASMLLTHPDAPHTGMFCAFLGLGYLAIKGGTIHLILREALVAAKVTDLRLALALECLAWGAIILAAEALTRILYYKFYVNTAWIGRNGSAPALAQSSKKLTYAALALGTATDLARAHIETRPGRKTHPVLMGLGGWGIATILAIILISIFVQSELKGQVLFGAFVAFALAVFFADLVFPDAPAWFMWMSIPTAAAIGYLMAASTMIYPGEAASAVLRALPVDYVAAGIPGAIVGYYMGLQFRLHALGEES